MVQEAIINAKMSRMQQALTQFEQLQVKREEMMKSAITIAELLEPVPRSILLATLTNNLPPGASLLDLDITQTDPGSPDSTSNKKKSNYQAAKATTTAKDASTESPEHRLITSIDITGIAMTDLQVAAYIKQLDDSPLMEQVALIESQEHKVDDNVYRKFHLKAQMCKDIHLTPAEVDGIRKRAQTSVLEF